MRNRKSTGFLAPSLIIIFVFFACYLFLMSFKNIVVMNKSYEINEGRSSLITTNNFVTNVKSQMEIAVSKDDYVHLFMVGLQLRVLYNSGLISIYEWDESVHYLKSITKIR